MHELAIMQSALNMALERAQQAGARKVYAIRMKVGVLSGVAPEALRFAFEALAPGTAAQGAELAIDEVPARFWCTACSQEFQARDVFPECPGCHSASADLRAGRDLEIASMEID
jgi:hydrogenase nickel incorporation protein HypA/HybF